MTKTEFEQKGPVLTESAARREATAAILKVMGLKSEIGQCHDRAREIYLQHGLWVEPKRPSSTLHFRDRAHGGVVRPLEPRSRKG